jgi:hypothetical protein
VGEDMINYNEYRYITAALTVRDEKLDVSQGRPGTTGATASQCSTGEGAYDHCRRIALVVGS